MARDFKSIMREVVETYLDKLTRGHESLEPAESYLPYDFDSLGDVKWRGLGGMLVKDELQELTNLLNRWHHWLRRWHAWNGALTCYEGEESWELRDEFVEALAHYCLMQPSAMRDTFTFVVTNAMHQVRLCIDADCPDWLEGDSSKPEDRPRTLRRGEKEKRLAKLLAPWPESASFLSELNVLNDKEYQTATRNYRNLSSHAIAPRFGVGITRMVRRSVVQVAELIEQEDGTFVEVPVPGKMAPSYSFGGTEPLDFDASRIANLEQYRRARQCYTKYRALLVAALELSSLWEGQ